MHTTETHFSTIPDVRVRAGLGENFTVAVLLQEPKRCRGANWLQRRTWDGK